MRPSLRRAVRNVLVLLIPSLLLAAGAFWGWVLWIPAFACAAVFFMLAWSNLGDAVGWWRERRRRIERERTDVVREVLES